MKNKKNYSLVAYLTGEEYKKVRELQKELSKITGSRKCLEDWLPHVTVGDGVVVTDEKLPGLEKSLNDFSEKQKVVRTRIKGFGGTENWKGAVDGKITPYVIWLDVELNSELLKLFNGLRDSVITHYDTWLPRTVNYVPHVTLAFADLGEEGYRKGIAYLSSRQSASSLEMRHVALVECYGVGNMVSAEYKKFYFADDR